MKKMWCWLLAAVLFYTGVMAGCGPKEMADSEPDYSALIVPPVDLTITDCISEQELSAILGTSMTLLGVYEESSNAMYQSADGVCMVTINMRNQTRAGFDAAMTGIDAGVTLQEGVGEVACWYGDPAQLMLYSSGYAVEVAVTGSELTQTQTYILQIADGIVKKLPQE